MSKFQFLVEKKNISSSQPPPRGIDIRLLWILWILRILSNRTKLHRFWLNFNIASITTFLRLSLSVLPGIHGFVSLYKLLNLQRRQMDDGPQHLKKSDAYIVRYCHTGKNLGHNW